MAHIFENQDMAGAAFREVSLREAVFDGVDLAEATIINSNLKGLSIADPFVATGMTIFGIPVERMIDAELDRRDPERARLHMDDPHDPETVRAAVERLRALRSDFRATLRSTAPEVLRQRPEEKKWSAIEHLRHLVFAEDLNINRWILRNEEPFSKLGLLPQMWAQEPAFADVGAEPSDDLEEILTAWDKIHSRTTAFLGDATREDLSQDTSDVDCGEGTVGGIFQMMCHHDLEHIRLAKAALNVDQTGSGPERTKLRFDLGIRWERGA